MGNWNDDLDLSGFTPEGGTDSEVVPPAPPVPTQSGWVDDLDLSEFESKSRKEPPKQDMSVGKFISYAGRNVVAGTLDAAKSFLATGEAPFMKAEEGLIDKGISALRDTSEKIAAPKTGNKMVDYPLEAFRSTSQSITSMLPFALSKGKTKAGRIVKGIAGKGLVFGGDQYYEFMDEVRDNLTKQGVDKADIDDALSRMRPYAAASGAMESVGEITTDLITAKIFGLVGSKNVKEPVKKGVMAAAGRLGKKFGISALSEVFGEELTTTGQWGIRGAAGLEQGDLKQQVIDTAGVTLWQTLLQGTLAAGTKRAFDRASKKLADDKQITVEEAADLITRTVEQERAASKPKDNGGLEDIGNVDASNIIKNIEKDEENAGKIEEIRKKNEEVIASFNKREKETAKQSKRESKAAERAAKKAAKETGKGEPAAVSGEEVQVETGVQEPVVTGTETETTVPVMITNAMKSSLTDLGYSDEDVSKMTPQQAWEVINGKTNKGIEAEPNSDENFIKEEPEASLETERPNVTMTEVGGEDATGIREDQGRTGEQGDVTQPSQEEGGKDLEQSVQPRESARERRKRERAEKKEVAPKSEEVKPAIHKKEVYDKFVNNLLPLVREQSGNTYEKVPTHKAVIKEWERRTKNGEQVSAQGVFLHLVEQMNQEKEKKEKKAKLSKEEIAEVNKVIDEVTDPIYFTKEEAEAARDEIHESRRNDFVVVGEDEEWVIEPVRDTKGKVETKKETNGLEDSPIWKSAEETAAETEFPDTVDGSLSRLINAVNTFLHTGQGDIIELGKQADHMIEVVLNDTRYFLGLFNNDARAYNAWNTRLLLTAQYISNVISSKTGQQLGEKNDEELTQDIKITFKELLIDDRGAVDLEQIAKSAEKVIELGRRVYEHLYDTFKSWHGKMRSRLIGVWKKVGPYILDAWNVINNEHGEVKAGDDILTRLRKRFNNWSETNSFFTQKVARYEIGGTEYDVTNTLENDINAALPYIYHAFMFNVKNFPGLARQFIVDIVKAKLWMSHNVEIEREFIEREVMGKLNMDQRIAAQKLGLEVEALSRMIREGLAEKGVAQKDIDVITRQEIADFIDNYEGADKVTKEVYRKVRSDFFDRFRKLYKGHLFDQLRDKLKPEHRSAITAILSGTQEGLAMTNNGIVTRPQITHFKRVLKDFLDDVAEINNWGSEDYWTRVMAGEFTIVEKLPGSKGKGRVIAAAPSISLALERARNYIQEQTEHGETVGSFSLGNSFAYQGNFATMVSRRQYLSVRGRLNKLIEDSLKAKGADTKVREEANSILRKGLKDILGVAPAKVFAAPTKETKNLLMGEEDIVEALKLYSVAMWKKMAFDGVIQRIEYAEDKLPANIMKHIRDTLEDAKGRYFLEDKMLDGLIRFISGNRLDPHMSASKAVGVVRSMTVWSKLGYRPISAILNGLDGASKVWMEYTTKYMGRAELFLKTPHGRSLINNLSWALGARAFEDQGQAVKGGARMGRFVLKGGWQMLSPMGMFNLSELPNRQRNFAVAYLYIKDIQPNISEQARIDFALSSVWALQGANVIAAMPKIMRSPTGRLLTLFWPYLFRTLEWIGGNANRPMFWAKFLPYTFLVAGPRGLIAMFKSLPILGWLFALGGMPAFWDKVSEAMQRSWGGIASGLPGILGPGGRGFDVVGPATAQLPEGLPATIDTMLKIHGEIIKPYLTAEANEDNMAKEGIKRTIPSVKNIWDVIDSYYDNDGWVRDENGDKVYNLNSTFDRTVVALGAKPVEKAYLETYRRVDNEELKHKQQHVREIIGAYKQLMVRRFEDKRATEIPSEVVRDLNRKMMKYNIDGDTVINALDDIKLAPGLKMLLREELVGKPKMFKNLKEAEKTFGVSFTGFSAE